MKVASTPTTFQMVAAPMDHSTCPTCKGEGKVMSPVAKAIEETTKRQRAREQAQVRWLARSGALLLCLIAFPVPMAVMRGLLQVFAWVVGSSMYRPNGTELTEGNTVMMGIAFMLGLVALSLSVWLAVTVWKDTGNEKRSQ